MKKLKPVKVVTRPNMTWTVSLAEEPNYLYVVVKGRFNIEQFNEMLDDVSDLKEGLPKHPVLFNDLEFDVSNVKKSDIASASTKFIMNNPSLAGSKVAIVMKTDQDLEIAARWKDMTEPSSEAKLSIFRTERHAMRWLTRSP
jgi:hypothetical protein